ncbi:DUF2304 domain-containing protein [Paenibacillus elgii]|uniref:DUF2304 domain-containing protein n=1 Tax=Paenibacillus elgii TaxID=189691 RepID=UPI00203DD8A9|nr:DUF2304 domain-containing protein [Paenibacillus elgii]MCM3272400.1 DUF2304 domain-containing protein [Paenibacillus elgii]
MISIKLQLFLVIISFAGLLMFINMIVKYKLELKYSLLWIFFSLVTIILAIFPDLSKCISDLLGFEKPVNAIFLFGIILTLIIIFSLTITLSSNQTKIKQLTQEIGINKLENSQLKEEINNLKTILKKEISDHDE